ncbi:MAG: ABC transporter permease [Solirubrobacterales bacterium]|nr:ABC transporter permease [Solirubrobacterales bacterium]MBV9471596.1 ABC transporter permease [Solirubrobacterales bacterium]MBV9837831.1 ABC transporter permease [Solirubrobacterales bacterium]
MTSQTSEVVIQAGRRRALDPRELWSFRELFYFFTWRDVKVRYRQTLIGAGWAIIQPLAAMLVFTVFFHNVAGVSSGNVPYAIFAYSGLLFWNYFSTVVTAMSNSLVNHQSVITKIYFPRVIPPVSSSLLGIVDFSFAFVIFVCLMIYYGSTPSVVGLLLIVPMLVLSLIFAVGVGILLAAVNVKYRDVRTAMPFLVQLMMFMTPVIYPLSSFPHRFVWIVNLNPMAGVISTMRAGLIGQGSIHWGQLGLSCVSAVIVLALGLSYFARSEKRFADII